MPTLTRFLSSRRLFGALLWTALAVQPVFAQPAGAPAVAAENPYAAVVTVADESDRSRDAGLRQALIEVLKRVAGSYDPGFSSILSRASALVQHYGFVRDETAGTTKFRASFDPQGVDAALKSQGLSVFGVDSAVIDAWIVRIDGLRDAADYARVMQHFTGIRGVSKVDVDELRDGYLRLRMIVEGGTARAAQLALSGGLLRSVDTDHYVIAGR
ncbi:MAG: DUF2066 domain-containing protein [Panacagrimonas sp.]